MDLHTYIDIFHIVKHTAVIMIYLIYYHVIFMYIFLLIFYKKSKYNSA